MTRRLLCLMTPLLLWGCAHEGPTMGSKIMSHDVAMDSVVLLDKDLDQPSVIPFMIIDKVISVERHGSRKSPTGGLQALVLLRNRTDEPVSVEARTTFFDGSKFATGRPSAWVPINLPPQGMEQYQESSLELAAAHYNVEVRRAHRR